MAVRLCKSAVNAADDGHVGLQVPPKINVISVVEDTNNYINCTSVVCFDACKLISISCNLSYSKLEEMQRFSFMEPRKGRRGRTRTWNAESPTSQDFLVFHDIV